jgi:hypothetical protein
MKKWSKKHVSVALIAIATSGFAWATYYDWRIGDLEKKVEGSWRIWDERERDAIRAMNQYDVAWQAHNHHQILQLLRAPPQAIDEAKRGIEMNMKNAIVYLKPGRDTENEIQKLHSYSELLPVFVREQKKTGAKAEETINTIFSPKETVSSMERFRNGLYIFFLILNTAGLVLGLLIQDSDGDGRSRAERGREQRHHEASGRAGSLA